jgi:pimeloyl-ACP methyl ester carboxylesterase
MATAIATREATMRLHDGRRIAWSSCGPGDGVPVVYLHGAIGTPVDHSPALAALIAQLGIRYIALSRPGFGRSDPCPGRRIADFPVDLERVADRLGIGRMTVVGVSAGGPYVLACARALPDRVAAAAAVSSLSPLRAPHSGRSMPVHLRLGLRAVVRRPDLAARGGTRAMRIAERRLRALARVARIGATPADRDLLAAAEGGTAAVESFVAAAAGGARGMIDDYLTVCTAWGFELRDVVGEVHLWHGEQDRFVPVEHARAVAAALPRCRATYDAQDGHFFFRRRLAEVLGALVAAYSASSVTSADQPNARAARPRPVHGS